VIERQGSKRPVAAEAFPDTIIPLLQELGILSSLEPSGFLRCGKTRLDWGASPRERRISVLLADRRFFDLALLESTRKAGAAVFAPARCRRTSYSEGLWSVAADGKDGPVHVSARFLVQATGRRGDQVRLGPRTAALCGRWHGARLPREPEMRLAARPDGWLWAAPLADGSYAVTCFVDASRCAARDRVARQQLYYELIAGASVGRSLDRAELIGDLKVRDATRRHAADLVTDRSIKIGDAAFAMDPISSQGVQAALRGGMQASIVVNTILGDGDVDAAMTFYRQTQQHAVARHIRAAGEIYASQSDYPTPFWRERSIDVTGHDGSALRRPMAEPNTPLRLSPAAGLQEMPAIEGMIVRAKLSLSCPSLDRPVAWFGGIEIAPLLAQIRPGSTLLSLFSDWSRAAPANIVQALLEWLVGERILISDDDHAEKMG
jgi:2-polyprenyl-6-methoxyphenol hydroxylase-like FAD-dependent oxidoreductase